MLLSETTFASRDMCRMRILDRQLWISVDVVDDGVHIHSALVIQSCNLYLNIPKVYAAIDRITPTSTCQFRSRERRSAYV